MGFPDDNPPRKIILSIGIDNTTPGAGAPYGFTVPSKTIARPMTMGAKLTTSAVAGNRFVYFVFRLGLNESMRVRTTFAQPAAQTHGYWFGFGLGAVWDSGFDHFLPLPEVYIQPFDSIQVNAVNLDAGDQFGSCYLVYEKVA